MGHAGQLTVLVTGAGGAATPTLIEHLQGLGYRVIACDMDKHAAGLYFADKGYVIPPASDPHFVHSIMRICDRENACVVIPLVDEELMGMANLVDGFRGVGGLSIKFIMPQLNFIKTCLDKWDCMRALRRVGEARVPIGDLFDGRCDPYYPSIIKPRVGRGSRGIHHIPHKGALLNALIRGDFQYSDALIAQEYIDGPEYTISVVCDYNNTVHAVVPKEIIDKRGITRIAVTRRNERIDAVCRGIAVALKPCGPFNVQLRMRDGEPYVFEINPRFSTSVTLTMAAGCDEVGGLVALALGKPYQWGEWREGVVLVRRTQDVVMDQAYLASRGPQEG